MKMGFFFCYILLFVALAQSALAVDCVSDAIEKRIREKYEAKLKRREQAEQARAEAERKRAEQMDRELANIGARLEFARNRTKDPTPLKPSEVRELKAAAAPLEEEAPESAAPISRRIQHHETKYAYRKRKSGLAPDQKALIEKKIRLSPLAEKQLKNFSPPLRSLVTEKLFLEIAQNPMKAGESYAGNLLVGGFSKHHYKKLKFAYQAEYRLIYRTGADDGTVTIETIATRASVYKGRFQDLGVGVR